MGSGILQASTHEPWKAESESLERRSYINQPSERSNPRIGVKCQLTYISLDVSLMIRRLWVFKNKVYMWRRRLHFRMVSVVVYGSMVEYPIKTVVG